MLTDFNKVKKTLKGLERMTRGNPKVSVFVGFSAAYAIHVHEDLKAFHRVGQAKFLEQPARELSGEIASVTKTAVERGATLEQGLVLAGLRLQRAAQKLVPVDTGNLKNSAFTAKEEDLAMEMARAATRGEEHVAKVPAEKNKR